MITKKGETALDFAGNETVKHLLLRAEQAHGFPVDVAQLGIQEDVDLSSHPRRDAPLRYEPFFVPR